MSVRGASDFLDGLGRQPESLPAASDRAVHDPVDLLERLEAGVCTFRVHVASVCAHWVRSAVVRARFGLARRVSVHPGFGLCPSACASRAPPEGIMALRVRTAGIRASRVRPLSICDFRVRGVSIQGRFSRLDGQGPNPRCADGQNPHPRYADGQNPSPERPVDGSHVRPASILGRLHAPTDGIRTRVASPAKIRARVSPSAEDRAQSASTDGIRTRFAQMTGANTQDALMVGVAAVSRPGRCRLAHGAPRPPGRRVRRRANRAPSGQPRAAVGPTAPSPRAAAHRTRWAVSLLLRSGSDAAG